MEISDCKLLIRVCITLLLIIAVFTPPVLAEEEDVDEPGRCVSFFRNGMRGKKFGVEDRRSDIELPKCENKVPEYGIPEHFDSRMEWPQCPSLWEIRDQGNCMSCWAVAISSVLTDRYCIQSLKQKGKVERVRFSDDDLLSCGTEAAAWKSNPEINGCDGGNVELAWKYLEANGTVSGGNYNSSEGCRPYEIRPCAQYGDQFGHRMKNISALSCTKQKAWDTPQCKKTCESHYKRDYETERLNVKSICTTSPTNNTEIQLEIMNNGPVVAVIQPYKEFLHFNPTRDGVYQTRGTKRCYFNHAVRIIGWGTQTDRSGNSTIPYWLVANSWNYYWGNYGGFFKILRAEPDNPEDRKKSLFIADHVSAGMPVLRNIDDAPARLFSQLDFFSLF